MSYRLIKIQSSLGYILSFCLLYPWYLNSQYIGDFIPLSDQIQTTDFVIPPTHTFQRIIESGQNIANDSDNFTFRDNPDFTAYIPIASSNSHGYLSINHELSVGGVSILDIYFDTDELWKTNYAKAVDFNPFGGTSRNCSGGITPWGTVLTCEETTTTTDSNIDGYHDLGWTIEIDPAMATVIDKRWALGNFKHENAVVHFNARTVYQGTDDPTGYLYKFVADNVQDLSSGTLYVYKGSKNGNGNWLVVANSTQSERNSTVATAISLGATPFNGIEDVDIGHDGWVYFAVKGESTIYRFLDSDPVTGTIVTQMSTFIGPSNFSGGLPGIDNLSFDCEGNLWALQDGGRNHIWFVKEGSNTPVIFGRTPIGSEPTGLTFTPDCRYGFISIQHPSASNNSTAQIDAAGDTVLFDKSVSLVFSRNEDLGYVNQTCHSAVVDAIINYGNDDVEEKAADGTMYNNSTDLELVDDNEFNGADQTIGLRFNNVSIPQGAKINRAYLQFDVDELSSTPATIFIQAEASDNSTSLTAANYGLSSRPKTIACATWPNIPSWTREALSGTKQRSSDLSTVIEEVTDRIGWSSTNSILLILNGSGKRVAESFEGSSLRAPKLHIEYEYCSGDGGCSSYGHQSLTGVLPVNSHSVEKELTIGGSTISPFSYDYQAGTSIELKPGTCIALGSSMLLNIIDCYEIDLSIK